MFCFPEYARLCVMQHVSGMPPHRVWSQGPEKVGFFRALFSDSTSVSVSVETGGPREESARAGVPLRAVPHAGDR